MDRPTRIRHGSGTLTCVVGILLLVAALWQGVGWFWSAGSDRQGVDGVVRGLLSRAPVALLLGVPGAYLLWQGRRLRRGVDIGAVGRFEILLVAVFAAALIWFGLIDPIIHPASD